MSDASPRTKPGRKPVYVEATLLRLERGTLGRIDVELKPEQTRADWLRMLVEERLKKENQR